jgi:hypothetical protein
MQSPFAEVHRLAAQQRLSREDVLLPVAQERARAVQLEEALRDLLQVGDRLKLAQGSAGWHPRYLNSRLGRAF